MLLIQITMVTPLFGKNLFVIHSIRGRGRLTDVERGLAPSVVGLLIIIALCRDGPAALVRAGGKSRQPLRPRFHVVAQLPHVLGGLADIRFA